MYRCRRLVQCTISPLKEIRRHLILGIETSCDDTGAAVLDLKGSLLGESISTQLSTRYGGVIPTFAMVFHLDKIQSVVDEALKQAGASYEDLSAIAVTNRPGLKGPLIIGTDYAKYLCMKYRKPMIPIHHMAAHAFTVRMEEKVEFPFMFLLISGGHCLIGIAKDIDEFSILGSSIDDSPGETLDKVARRLKVHTLPHMRDLSGGRAIEILSKGHEKSRVEFGIPKRSDRDCNFSFSGLKGHLDMYLKRVQGELPSHEIVPQVGDVCAGMQYSVTKHLCERLQRAIEYVEYDELMKCGGTLVVSGGVASNQYIRAGLSTVCETMGWKAVYPKPKLCTDNGIMIGWAGYEFWSQQRGLVQPDEVLDVPVIPRSPMGENISERVTAANLKCKWIPINPAAVAATIVS